MNSISHLSALLRNAQRALLRYYRSHTLVVSLSCKATAWVRAMLAAWKPNMLSVRYTFCASYVQGALCTKADMARALLTHHSFTLAYAPKFSLFSSLLGVYQRQVRTIGGATLHHMSMSHQRYIEWASMMVYRMRAHEQWLNRSMEEAARLYNRAFRSTGPSATPTR